MPDIKITLLGAGQEVGRSCILLSMGGKNVMLDCGMHMGYNDMRRYPDFSYIAPKGALTNYIDCVIISHFHLDHCGALPYLTEVVGYEGPIYMSLPTKAIVPMLLQDMCNVSLDKKGESNQTMYTPQNIKDCMKKVETLALHQSVMVDSQLEIKCYYAGHVLGAAMFWVRVGSESVVYTGDFNMTPDRHLGSAWIDKCRPDVLITESTYATTIRDSKHCRERDFLKKIHACVERGGKVLIPVFALGRAQELCILLETYWERMNLKVPVYFASGLTELANKYYRLFVTWTNQKIRQTFTRRNLFDFKHIGPFDKSYIDNPGAMVVLATPGMLHAGLSLHIFKKWATDEKNMVIMPGFCVVGTMGHRLLGGVRDISSEGSRIRVKMAVEYMSFSAHADAKGIIQLIQYCEPKNVMLVHGEGVKMEFLKEKIKTECGIECYMPINGETCIIHTLANVDLDVSLKLLKGEKQRYNASPPDPTHVRMLDGVVVIKKDNSICLMDIDDACKEGEITKHDLKFTSKFHIEDPSTAPEIAEKFLQWLRARLPQCRVQQAEDAASSIMIDNVMVRVEGEEDGKHVLVSWNHEKEELGRYILSLLKSMEY